MLLQASVDISLPQTTVAQQAVAWVVIGAGIVATLYLLYRTHYHGLPERLKRAKADLRGARADTTLQSVYVPRDVANDAERVERIVHSVLDEDPPEQPTLRTAAGSVQRQLAETWVPILARLPPAARRVLGLAAVIVVFGLVAVSTESLVGLLSASSPQTQPARWPALAVSETGAVVGRVGGFPGVSVIWPFVVLVAVTLGSWLYSQWYLVAGALLAGAYAIYRLERQLQAMDDSRWARERAVSGTADARTLAAALDMDDGPIPVARGDLASQRHAPSRTLHWIQSLPTPGTVARAIVAGIGSLWLITIMAVGIGRLTTANDTAVFYGAVAFVAAGLVYLAVAGAVVARNWGRITALPERWAAATPLQQRYLAARGLTLGLATLVAPLVPIWAGVALTKTPTLLGAYFAADIGVQVIGAVLFAAVAAVLAWQAQAAWGDVRSAVRITTAQSSARSAALARGVPYIVVAGTYALVGGLFQSIILGVVVAIAVGLAAREGVALLTRARYRVSVRDRGPTAAQRVVIEGAPLSTRDGDVQWYVRINGGTELLHPHRKAVVSDAVQVTTQLVADGNEPPTLSERHAESAFEHGATDPEETVRKLDQTVRQTLYHALRSHGDQVPNEHLDDEIEDIPEPIVSARFEREEYELGNISRGEQYTTLRNDPYRS